MSREPTVESVSFRLFYRGEGGSLKTREAKSTLHSTITKKKMEHMLQSRWYLEAAGVEKMAILDILDRYPYSQGMTLILSKPDVREKLALVSDPSSVARKGLEILMDEIINDVVDGSSLCEPCGTHCGDFVGKKAWLTADAIIASLLSETMRVRSVSESKALERAHLDLAYGYYDVIDAVYRALEDVIAKARARGEDMSPVRDEDAE
jgi:hypothetical protein